MPAPDEPDEPDPLTAAVPAAAAAPGTVDPNRGLGRKTVSGISWTLFGSVISNVLRIVIIAVLGRLLSAEDFSVVAAAMIVVFFAVRLRDAGIGIALVQRKDITREHVEAAFGFSLGLGVVLAGALLVCAEPVARALGRPDAIDPIRALSALFVIRGFSSVSQFLCQRELQFRALALIDVVAYAVGSVVAISLAATGWGPWSLVIGYLVETGIDSALVFYIRPAPWPRIRWRPLRDLLGLGGGQTLAHFANYFATQGDYIVVGRYLERAALGVYTRAYELMRFPAVVFNNVAGSVLFSSFARIQDDPERLGQAYRRVLFANAVVLLPASAGLIVLAPEAVRILLGPGWADVVIPFQILATSMLFRTNHKASVIVARSVGDVFAVTWWSLVYAAAVIGGGMISKRWGITGVSVTTAAAVLLHYVNLTRLALRRVSFGWGTVIAAHGEGIVMTVLSVAGALPVALGLRHLGVDAAVVAIAGTIAGLLLPVGYVVRQVRRGHADWTWLLERLIQLVKKKRKKRRKPRGPDAGGGADATTPAA